MIRLPSDSVDRCYFTSTHHPIKEHKVTDPRASLFNLDKMAEQGLVTLSYSNYDTSDDDGDSSASEDDGLIQSAFV